MPKAAPKPIIGLDIDDVLAANAHGFATFSNKRWGTKLVADDYTEDWAALWQVDFDEVMRRREVIIKSKVFTNHEFFEDAKPALRHLAKRYKLVAVSSRGPRVQADTVKWLGKEYGDLISEFYFADIWDLKDVGIHDKLKMTKTDLLLKVGAKYLIDDQPKHCTAAAKAGIKSVLFGQYRWNEEIRLLPNMVRAKTWLDVRDYFDGQD